MALRIRLWQQGCTNNLCYRVVVADGRSPRDGKYVEAIGWYNPEGKTEELKRHIQPDRLLHWLSVGAQMSATVAAVVKKAAPEAMKEFVNEKNMRHESKIAKRRAKA
jgi:small subunit ribosomal protein S16